MGQQIFQAGAIFLFSQLSEPLLFETTTAGCTLPPLQAAGAGLAIISILTADERR